MVYDYRSPVKTVYTINSVSFHKKGFGVLVPNEDKYILSTTP